VNLDRIDRLMDQALAAKHAYDEAIAQLLDLRKECAKFRKEFTAKAHKQAPELLARWNAAYQEGERIKDQMYKGNRWPKDTPVSGPGYSDILRSVPVEQRSPEMIQCLAAWEGWEKCRAEWVKMFPEPKHFHWNGPHLMGPNLWKDFKISYEVADCG